MAERFEVAENRLFRNVFICMKCNARIRTNSLEKARCRKCGSKSLRPKHKEAKR